MESSLYFPTTGDFEEWLEKNHDKADEVWVKFYKKATGKPTMSWSESVDVALCFGWIDGIRKSIDEESYMNRFTPRRPGSNWSKINIEKINTLMKAGRLRPSGLKVYEERDPKKTESALSARQYEKLDRELEKRFRAEKEAWNFFQAQPPGYKKTALSWIMTAKQEETRLKRLGLLINDSTNRKRLNLVAPGK